MDQQLDEPDLRSYLGVVGRRKRWVVGVTALFFGVAVAMSLLPDPKYEAEATILTSTGADLPALALGGANGSPDVNRDAENHAARVAGYEMRAAVVNSMPSSLSSADVFRVKVSPVRSNDANKTSSVVSISLVHTDPEAAASIVNFYAETYVSEWDAILAERYTTVMGQLDLAVQGAEDDIDALRVQYDDLVLQRETAIDQGDNANAARLERDLNGMQVDLDNLHDTKNFYADRLDKLTFGTGVQFGDAEVIGPSPVPGTAVSPNIPKNLAIGLVFGLFLGVAVAFIRDYFDDSVKSKEIVEQVTGVPALGLIPKFSTSDSELVVATAPSAPAAEAFRSLRTSVKFLSVDREIRVLQITSPSPSEGKTVTAINLAAVFAQAGDRVVLVGADLRRPRAEEILNVSLTPGLTGVLIGEVALPQAIRAVDGLPNLSVLPAGYPPPNPSELLSGERARRLIDVLAQTYDVVVLDCPPVLPVSDSLVLAGMADATLLVTSANRTSRRSLNRCVEVLQQVSAPLVGTIMTSLAPGETFGSGPYSYDGGGSSHYKSAPAYQGGNGTASGAHRSYASDATSMPGMSAGSPPPTTPTQTIAPLTPPDGERWPGGSGPLD